MNDPIRKMAPRLLRAFAAEAIREAADELHPHAEGVSTQVCAGCGASWGEGGCTERASLLAFAARYGGAAEPPQTDRWMMATTAHHVTGDISRDEPDLACIYGEADDHFIGKWATGLGFVNSRWTGKPARSRNDGSNCLCECHDGAP
jgi:hypothetical protein